VRFIGLDAHRDFCEVAICEEGRAPLGAPDRDESRGTCPVRGKPWARRPGRLECTGHALAIARVLSPHAGRVVIAHAKAVRTIAWAKVKNDRADARALPRCWPPGPTGGVDPRRADTAAAQVRGSASSAAQHRTSAKNAFHATLQRNPVGRAPATDLFGRRGRTWLSSIQLPRDEQDWVGAPWSRCSIRRRLRILSTDVTARQGVRSTSRRYSATALMS
jgi:hypothetical protein